MSYDPLIEIKTKNDELILHCEFSSGDEYELLDALENFVREGLAIYSKGTRGDCYPAVLSVLKESERVKSVLIPIIEKLFTKDKATETARFHYKRTADKEDLRQEHVELEEKLKILEKKKIEELEALKSFSDEEGFIIEAWGTLWSLLALFPHKAQ